MRPPIPTRATILVALLDASTAVLAHTSLQPSPAAARAPAAASDSQPFPDTPVVEQARQRDQAKPKR